MSALAKAGSAIVCQNDAPRTGDDGVEKTLAAEEDVLRAADGLHIDLARGVHHGEIAGVHNDLLSRRERILDRRAVDLQKRHAVAGELAE